MDIRTVKVGNSKGGRLGSLGLEPNPLPEPIPHDDAGRQSGWMTRGADLEARTDEEVCCAARSSYST